LAEFDVEILYASMDTPEQNTAFARSLDARTPVVSDPTGETARRYGVVSIGGFFPRRWTFYIDERGILREIDRGVNPATAGQDIVERLGRLGFPRHSSEGSTGAPTEPVGESAPEGEAAEGRSGP
jgi:peroxiredoxin